MILAHSMCEGFGAPVVHRKCGQPTSEFVRAESFSKLGLGREPEKR